MLAGLAAASLMVPFGIAGLAQQNGAQQNGAQQNGRSTNVDQTRSALERALAEASAAEERGKKLEAEARSATEEAEKTARQAAALAARIQQAEAGIAAADARIALIAGQRIQLGRRLAQRREPLVRLTAALQKLARRPPALSALRPGSLRETVYLRAMLETTIPQVQSSTADLRADLRILLHRFRQLRRARPRRPCEAARKNWPSAGQVLPHWNRASVLPRAAPAVTRIAKSNARSRWQRKPAISMH